MHSTVNAHSDVLLKTAITPVWSENRCIITTILFDQGAQNSFITEDLARKLEIEPTAKIAMKISGFGGSESQVRYFNKAKIDIETDDEQKLEIEVIIVPKIAAPIQTKSRNEIKTLPYLNGLKLAHPITAEDKFNISLLIGADFYWSIVENEIIRGD